MEKNAGFSIVEILSVVFILLVLALLSVSVINSMINKVNQTRCLQNLRQIGMDIRIYMGENQGVLPWLEQPFITTRWWYRLYSPNNFKDFNKHLICPSDSDPYTLLFRPQSGETLKCSYLFNKNFGYSESDGVEKLGGIQRNFLTAKNSARLRMVADAPISLSDSRRPHKTSDSMGFNGVNDVFGNDKEGMHQLTFANILFLDGHVEMLNAEKFNLTDSTPIF